MTTSRSLTVTNKPKRLGVTRTIAQRFRWIDNSSSLMVASDGSVLVFNELKSAYPILLLAAASATALTVEKRSGYTIASPVNITKTITDWSSSSGKTLASSDGALLGFRPVGIVGAQPISLTAAEGAVT